MTAIRAVTTPPAWVVGCVSLVATLTIVAGGLAAFDGDPTVFVSFGADVPTRGYAEERLGEIVLRGALGHDGKFFFVQGNDPWVIDPANNARFLDFPVYRSQRMLYPLLAGGFGLFGPETVVWGLVIVNVAAMALGTLGAARLARTLGGSSWWGLSFLANLGLLYTLTIDSADILATACAMWGVVSLYENRLWPAITLFTAAALSREVMLLSAAGTAIWLWTQNRRREAFYVVSLPASALLIWEIYIRIRLGPDQTGVNALGWPLVGLVRAFPRWLQDPIVLTAGICTVAFLVIFVMRWWPNRSLLGWAFAGFVPLALLMTEKVWNLIFDFTRAVAPLLTATLLVVFVERHSAYRGRRDALASSEVQP